MKRLSAGLLGRYILHKVVADHGVVQDHEYQDSDDLEELQQLAFELRLAGYQVDIKDTKKMMEDPLMEEVMMRLHHIIVWQDGRDTF